tara:strand:+ start:8524 stop:8757 length:234 start_codon:yes stop_codon:yes gene_type:complete
MITIEVGPNLGAFLLAALASLGTIVTATLAYFNGKRLRQVEKNTNGMTERLVEMAREEGRLLGHAEERARLNLPAKD